MNIIYIIKSLNTDKYYINSSNYKHTSLILHKFINSYKKHIKYFFKSIFKIIKFNPSKIIVLYNEFIGAFMRR